MIVCKFGGTSVAKADGAKCIKNIVNKNTNIKFVVVSALGKSEQHNTKITDLLFLLYNKLTIGEDYTEIVNEIFNRYKDLSEQLNVNIEWNKLKTEFLLNLNNKTTTKEFIVSRGEYYSSILYAKYLDFNILDAKDYIIFDKHGKFCESKTRQKLIGLNLNKRYVIGGYYGAKSTGAICVFDRGGSDITGAIICKALNFDIYQNFTDVNGIYNKNPNIFYGAQNLPAINYQTAICMAEGGNEIVHKDALKIIKNSNVLLLVKSTYNNEAFGTVVLKNDILVLENFICVNDILVIETKHTDKNFISYIKNNADVLQIIKSNRQNYIIAKSLYMPTQQIKEIDNILNITAATAILIFSKNQLKNIKNIKKISKNIKKYCIFAKFLSINNNFLILCNKENKQKIINILNKYNI